MIWNNSSYKTYYCQIGMILFYFIDLQHNPENKSELNITGEMLVKYIGIKDQGTGWSYTFFLKLLNKVQKYCSNETIKYFKNVYLLNYFDITRLYTVCQELWPI